MRRIFPNTKFMTFTRSGRASLFSDPSLTILKFFLSYSAVLRLSQLMVRLLRRADGAKNLQNFAREWSRARLVKSFTLYINRSGLRYCFEYASLHLRVRLLPVFVF